MRVQDLMTRDVITVGADTPVREAARLLVDHGISGLPVTDPSGALVGIVTEADIMARERPRPRSPWWRALLADPDRLARDYQRVAGCTVAEVMTRSVVSIVPDATLGAAAELLHRSAVRRLPVVSEGRVVGILSRADVVRAVAMAQAAGPGPVSDAQLVAEMRRRIDAEPWISYPGIVVQAHEGVLSLWGLARSDAERDAIETMARGIDGVRGVESHLVRAVAVPPVV